MSDTNEYMIEAALTVIGGGNMAEAMVRGWIEHRLIKPSRIHVVEPQPERREVFAVLGCNTYEDASQAFVAEIVVLAVKPQAFANVMQEWQQRLSASTLISIMAGVNTSTISERTGSAAVVRAMPNTPAMVGRGVTGVFSTDAVDEEAMQTASHLLSAIGHMVVLEDEALLHAVTALTGSGPGYLMAIAEAMQRGAEVLGLSEVQTRQMIPLLFEGAGLWAAKSDESFASLRQKVTSPGGTTAAGLQVMQDEGMAEILVETLKAADNRSREMEASS